MTIQPEDSVQPLDDLEKWLKDVGKKQKGFLQVSDDNKTVTYISMKDKGFFEKAGIYLQHFLGLSKTSFKDVTSYLRENPQLLAGHVALQRVLDEKVVSYNNRVRRLFHTGISPQKFVDDLMLDNIKAGAKVDLREFDTTKISSPVAKGIIVELCKNREVGALEVFLQKMGDRIYEDNLIEDGFSSIMQHKLEQQVELFNVLQNKIGEKGHVLLLTKSLDKRDLDAMKFLYEHMRFESKDELDAAVKCATSYVTSQDDICKVFEILDLLQERFCKDGFATRGDEINSLRVSMQSTLAAKRKFFIEIRDFVGAKNLAEQERSAARAQLKKDMSDGRVQDPRKFEAVPGVKLSEGGFMVEGLMSYRTYGREGMPLAVYADGRPQERKTGEYQNFFDEQLQLLGRYPQGLVEDEHLLDSFSEKWDKQHPWAVVGADPQNEKNNCCYGYFSDESAARHACTCWGLKPSSAMREIEKQEELQQFIEKDVGNISVDDGGLTEQDRYQIFLKDLEEAIDHPERDSRFRGLQESEENLGIGAQFYNSMNLDEVAKKLKCAIFQGDDEIVRYFLQRIPSSEHSYRLAQLLNDLKMAALRSGNFEVLPVIINIQRPYIHLIDKLPVTPSSAVMADLGLNGDRTLPKGWHLFQEERADRLHYHVYDQDGDYRASLVRSGESLVKVEKARKIFQHSLQESMRRRQHLLEQQNKNIVDMWEGRTNTWDQEHPWGVFDTTKKICYGYFASEQQAKLASELCTRNAADAEVKRGENALSEGYEEYVFSEGLGANEPYITILGAL